MTITDHSSPPQEVVVFGKSCDSIFGCTASHMKEYLRTSMPGVEATSLLYKAIAATLIGKCFAFTFSIPSNYTCPLTLSTILKLTSGLKTGSTDKGVQLVAMGIQMLSGHGVDTVINKLHQYLQDVEGLGSTSHPANFLESVPVSTDKPAVYCIRSNESSFFDEVASGASTSQKASLLLDTYTDSPESHTSAAFSTTAEQSPNKQPATLPADNSQILCTMKSQGCQKQPNTDATVTHPHSLVDVSAETAVDFDEYLCELSRNKALLRELESDWESTQQHNTCPPISPSAHYSFSEEMLKELQEPFSQLREGSLQHTTTVTPLGASTNSNLLSSATSEGLRSKSNTSNSLSSPELFSSVSASSPCSRMTVKEHTSTPRQLLFNSRLSSSPELFGSSSSKTSRGGTQGFVSGGQGSQQFKTPALSSRIRPQVPRRKLVKDNRQSNDYSKPSTLTVYHTPLTVNHQTSQPSVAHNDGFSPDIL